MNVSTIAGLRNQLAEARIALRESKEMLETARAAAETNAIDAAGGSKALGANERDRERALVLALAESQTYATWHKSNRDRAATVDRLEAELETALDIRRAQEWQIRERLTEALIEAAHLNAQHDSDTHDTPTADLLTNAAISDLAAFAVRKAQRDALEPWNPDYDATSPRADEPAADAAAYAAANAHDQHPANHYVPTDWRDEVPF